MSDGNRPGWRNKGSKADKAPAYRDRSDIEPEAFAPSIERAFGFARDNKPAQKRREDVARPSGKLGIGPASKMRLLGRPIKSLFSIGIRSNRSANLPLLPYEAAMLAASGVFQQKPSSDGKLIPIFVAAVIITVSVASGAAVWSLRDGGAAQAGFEPSMADGDAVSATLPNRDIQQEMPAPETNTPAVSVLAIETATQPTDLAATDDVQRSPPQKPVASLEAIKEIPNELIEDQASEEGQNERSIQHKGPLRRQPQLDDTVAEKEERENDVAAYRYSGFPIAQVLEKTAPRIEASILERPPTAMTRDRDANKVGRDRIEARNIAVAAFLENRTLARPLHRPALKPLEIAALVPTESTTSFKPVLRPRAVSLSSPSRAALTAGFDAVDRAEHTPTLKRFWSNLVHGVTKAFRNKDSSYQLASNAYSGGRGSDEDRGRSNDYSGGDGDDSGQGRDDRGNDNSGRGDDDRDRDSGSDNSGRGSDDNDRDSDNSGSGSDNSGRGSDDNDRDRDNSGSGSDNSGRGSDDRDRGRDRDRDRDNSGSGKDDDDD